VGHWEGNRKLQRRRTSQARYLQVEGRAEGWGGEGGRKEGGGAPPPPSPNINRRLTDC
jgi:hypothetical protein